MMPAVFVELIILTVDSLLHLVLFEVATNGF